MHQLKAQLEELGHEVDLLGNSPDYTKFHIVNRGLALEKEKLLPLLDRQLFDSESPYFAHDPQHVIRSYELDRYCMELSAAYFGLHQYDLIHTQDIFAARALSRVKPKHVPLVAHVHGSVATELHTSFRNSPQMGISEQSPEWQYFTLMEHYGAASADLTITANQWQKNILTEQFGVPQQQVAVFQYGLDAVAFWQKAHAGTTIRPPFGKKVIIFPARLTYVKGINVLIDALALLKSARRDWVCWIVGDGELRGALEHQVLAASLQHDVRFLGQRDDVPALLLQSDIFVHSCYQDNQPFSVMEAQLAGLPVIVSAAGGLPEMVEHGVTGLISPVGDAIMLYQQLKILLENDHNRKQLGANAQAWASQHWSMELMMSRLLDVYTSVQPTVR
ncbi:glycosyltransferase involved in cell wall biosynthesis [Paenibacillus phyllosphaerae]|uniref:Glycosyltransferase involved in cell wall biosynthesis n=1 Tax=Paenibacillus phyllosphaerae TaxID=274593 RepID=A0A7W5AWW2_9BACL|nr:glycosyltransferase involved in cell wall biosynthesis [Paenibacillus phyllosphaerae]